MKPIPDALVRVILTKSKIGSSITKIDKPKYTDKNGTAIFNAPSMGEYSIEVTVDGFEQVETTKNVNCDPQNCEGCSPVVTVHLIPAYCKDKFLKLVVMDCKTNSRLAKTIV